MRFAVMIPAYNPDGAQFGYCLRSVLRQLDPREHFVCVIDDGSLVPLARHLGDAMAAGVKVVRNDPELGGSLTHEQACGIGAANGDYVHVVHPDDAVLSEFYGTMAASIETAPGKALYAAWHLECDDQLRPFSAPRPEWLRDGKFQPLHEGNPLAVAATVTSAAFIRKRGGWDRRVGHTADWLHGADDAGVLPASRR